MCQDASNLEETMSLAENTGERVLFYWTSYLLVAAELPCIGILTDKVI